jgi:hypothetical protein
MPKNESPQLEVVKDTEKQPDTEEQLMQKVSEIEAAIAKCDDGRKVFEEQLVTLKKSFLAVKQSQGAEIDVLLEGIVDSSSKKLLDEVLQLSTPKVAQLTENISKVAIAIENVNRKRHKLHLEKKELQKQMDDERYNHETREICDLLSKWLEDYQRAEGTYDALVNMIPGVGDPRFFQRCVKLGYPVAYEVILNSHLQVSNLRSSNMVELAERIGNLGNSYGPALLQKRLDRQQNVQLRRENFMPDHAMFGKV